MSAASLLRLAAAGKGTWLARFAVLAAGLGISAVFFIQYCDLLFDCGCQALWAGRATHCNIHESAPPHCPWCVDGGAYGQWTFRAIAVAQGAVALWPGGFGRGRAGAVLLAFPAVGGAGGLLAGLLLGYWR